MEEVTRPKRRTRKKRKWWRVPFILLIVLALAGVAVKLIFFSGKSELDKKTFVTVNVSINPSIDLNLDKDYRVVSYSYCNDDAVDAFSALDLESISLTEAVNLLTVTATEKGYLTADNCDVVVTALTDDAAVQATVAQYAQQSVAAAAEQAQQVGAAAPVLNTSSPLPLAVEVENAFGSDYEKAYYAQRFLVATGWPCDETFLRALNRVSAMRIKEYLDTIYAIAAADEAGEDTSSYEKQFMVSAMMELGLSINKLMNAEDEALNLYDLSLGEIDAILDENAAKIRAGERSIMAERFVYHGVNAAAAHIYESENGFAQEVIDRYSSFASLPLQFLTAKEIAEFPHMCSQFKARNDQITAYRELDAVASNISSPDEALAVLSLLEEMYQSKEQYISESYPEEIFVGDVSNLMYTALSGLINSLYMQFDQTGSVDIAGYESSYRYYLAYTDEYCAAELEAQWNGFQDFLANPPFVG